MSSYPSCPRCGEKLTKSTFGGSHFDIYKCRDCGQKSCYKCGGKTCPKCDSGKYNIVGKVYAK